MGLFDRFKSKPVQLDDVLESLLNAAERDDLESLATLCYTHQDEIHEKFSAWKDVPGPVMKNRTSLNRYVQGLGAIATIFAEVGDNSLMLQLTGPPNENPMTLWEDDLNAAQAHVDAGRFSEAISLLTKTVTRNEELVSGTGVDYYLPRTFGLLGIAYFRTGEKYKAIDCMTKAKALCEESGDLEGVANYEANLQFIAEQ
jgi:tetratricopeptide (TPR) repeat protein